MRERVTRSCAASVVPRELRADARAAGPRDYSSCGRLAILSHVMRTLLVSIAAGAIAAAAVVAQAPQKPAPKPAGRPAPKPAGTLAQVMRGIYFPNANLIFDVQQHDPAAPKPKTNDASASATSVYGNAYSGWDVVENAAVALADGVDLILKP